MKESLGTVDKTLDQFVSKGGEWDWLADHHMRAAGGAEVPQQVLLTKPLTTFSGCWC